MFVICESFSSLCAEKHSSSSQPKIWNPNATTFYAGTFILSFFTKEFCWLKESIGHLKYYYFYWKMVIIKVLGISIIGVINDDTSLSNYIIYKKS